MKNFKLFYSIVVAGLLALSSAAHAVVWTFNLPSTATSGQNPAYPVVATLTLTQVGNDVQFFLDPNELSPGVANPATSFVDQIDFVISNRALNTTDYANIIASSLGSGAPIQSVTYWTNTHNMDSSYTTQDQHVVVNFVPSHGTNALSFNGTSSWTIAGVALTDFTGTYATSNSHPSPTYGVISVASYALRSHTVCGSSGNEVCTGTTSNWVVGAVSPVPEPETYAMLLVGLALIGFTAHCRKNFAA